MSSSPFVAAAPPKLALGARQAAVDWLRSLALVEIIGFHSRLGRIPLLAGLGLPLLLVITNMYNAPLAEKRGMRTLVRDKVRRLFVPWLFWCAVFALMTSVEAVRAHTPVQSQFTLDMLLFGTYVHLWFVPFAIFGGFAVGALQTWTRAWAPERVIVFAVVAGAFAVLLDTWLAEDRRIGSFGIWLFSLPSIPLGFALGRTLLVGEPQRARFLVRTVTAVAGLGWAASAMLAAPWPIYRYAAAVTLVGVALLLRIHDPHVAKVLAPLSLGIYFAHPLVMRTLMALHFRSTSVLLWAVLGFALTALLVALLRRTPLRRFV